MWNLRNRPQRIWVFCDGGVGDPRLGNVDATRERPTGPAGCAAVARGGDGAILQWAWQPLAIMTNNEAEYAGLLLGLQLARQLAAIETVCLLDSSTVVGQMQGRFSVNSPRLLPWYRQACMVRRQVANLAIYYIPRELNAVADGLARQARLPWATLRSVLDELMEDAHAPSD
jgi:ribonuclease HI